MKIPTEDFDRNLTEYSSEEERYQQLVYGQIGAVLLNYGVILVFWAMGTVYKNKESGKVGQLC